MAKNKITRREFLGKTAAGITGAAAMSAASYQRIMGANNRINIGFLGCGARGRGHRRMVNKSQVPEMYRDFA